MDFPIPPEFWWSTDNLSASIFLQGVDQKILPCGQGRIDSVKINPSLLMMRDCLMAPIQSDSTSIGLTSGRVIPLKNLPYSCKYSAGETLKV